MAKYSSLRYLWALLFVLLIANVHAQDFVPVPPLSAHVVDVVGMLNAQQRTALDNVLKEYETRTGSQIAILLISSTAPEAIEQYSIRVADAWKLGRKGIDDGVILVVAKNNDKALRRLRIETGRGVQGTITDAQSKRILQDVIAPHFRQNDFYGGLVAGVSSLTSLLDQEHLPASEKKNATASDSDDAWAPMFFGFLMLIMSLLSIGRARRDSLGNTWGGAAAGIILGGLGRGGGSSSGGGFSGGGGGFDGGGASGDW